MFYANIEQVPVPLRRFQGVPLQLEVINEIVDKAREMDGPVPVTFPLAREKVMEDYRLVSGQFVKKTDVKE